MKTSVAIFVLGGALLGFTGCYVEGQGYYPGPVIHERVVTTQPPVIVESPTVILDEPGVYFEPGITFTFPIIVWDDDARREIVIDRRDWDRWRLDRDGRRIDSHGHHYLFRRDARHHRRTEERPIREIRDNRDTNIHSQEGHTTGPIIHETKEDKSVHDVRINKDLDKDRKVKDVKIREVNNEDKKDNNKDNKDKSKDKDSKDVNTSKDKDLKDVKTSKDKNLKDNDSRDKDAKDKDAKDKDAKDHAGDHAGQ